MSSPNPAPKPAATFQVAAFLAHARRYAKRLPFAEPMMAMFFALKDPRTPMWVKGTVAAALAYFALPIDMVPDVIVGLGFTDDMAAVMTAYRAVSGHVTEAHRDEARHWLEGEG
jgi:uncharacterized membrane protein YkvA (DUF1232 family)